jgi:hypothetical protein
MVISITAIIKANNIVLANPAQHSTKKSSPYCPSPNQWALDGASGCIIDEPASSMIKCP